MHPLQISTVAGTFDLEALTTPLALEELAPGGRTWEVELGFGKGKYLLRRARAEPEVRFLGLEIAAKYCHRVVERVQRWGLANTVVIRGEALMAISSVLPRAFASAVHIYFPDPWPKARHHERRLLDPETVDLVLGLLEPGGTLFFATDHEHYGCRVEAILSTHPGVAVTALSQPWADGARTNYEDKYLREGRPIRRLAVVREAVESPDLIHPRGLSGIVAASQPWREAVP